mmetsp:Transcript_59594/g.115020  ORF Transcript_59594/g.115020 Transcript_59594/m.115020 type:complete len:157 (+) Transcript_59594:67-537(+)
MLSPCKSSHHMIADIAPQVSVTKGCKDAGGTCAMSYVVMRLDSAGKAVATLCSSAVWWRWSQRRQLRPASRRPLFAVKSKEAAHAGAAAENRMITIEESALRRAVGIACAVAFVWQTWSLFTTGSTTVVLLGSNYVLLAGLAGGAYGFLETANQSL